MFSLKYLIRSRMNLFSVNLYIGALAVAARQPLQKLAKTFYKRSFELPSVDSNGKESAMWKTWIRSLGQKDALEKGMATYSSILAWRIPGTEEPDGLQSLGHKESDMMRD